MLLILWLVSAVAIYVTAFLLPGAQVTFGAALVASLVLGLVNIFIKPILVFLTLPLNILTLGIFTLVINGILILIVSSIVPGFRVGGLGMAIIFAIVLAIINMIFFSVTGVK
jgi:putative membrane protein